MAALLRDLGADLRAGGAPDEAPAKLATGLATLDQLLGGGLPRGRLCEIVGRTGSGRTSLALALLAATTRTGELVAAVDLADAFDPLSAARAGVDLARTLWVRPRSVAQALRSAERLLQARGFALVLLDLEDPRTFATADWIRLARRAAAVGSTLVLLAPARRAGVFAELAVETRPLEPRFARAPETFTGREVRVVLARSRSRPTGGAVALPLDVEPLAP